MGGALPLRQHAVLTSHDLDEAREIVGRIFCPHRLELLHPGARLDARHHHVPLRDVSLNYVQYGDAVRIEPGPLSSFFLIQTPLRGSAEIRCGTRAIVSRPGLASVPEPTEDLRMCWGDGNAQLIVKISRAALENHVADLVDRPVGPLGFVLGFDLTSGLGARWWTLVQTLLADCEEGMQIRASPLALRQFESTLMSLLVHALPHRYSAWLQRPQAAAMPRHVKSAIDFMQARVAEPIHLPEIAAAAGVSVRGLQLGFRRFLDTNPMAYLRRIRLEKARLDLKGGGPESAVADIALKWGFAHLGRFAGYYRRRYGEAPSATIRRRGR